MSALLVLQVLSFVPSNSCPILNVMVCGLNKIQNFQKIIIGLF